MRIENMDLDQLRMMRETYEVQTCAGVYIMIEGVFLAMNGNIPGCGIAFMASCILVIHGVVQIQKIDNVAQERLNQLV